MQTASSLLCEQKVWNLKKGCGDIDYLMLGIDIQVLYHIIALHSLVQTFLHLYFINYIIVMIIAVLT